MRLPIRGQRGGARSGNAGCGSRCRRWSSCSPGTSWPSGRRGPRSRGGRATPSPRRSRSASARRAMARRTHWGRGAGLAQRLLGRERRSLEAEQLGRLLLPGTSAPSSRSIRAKCEWSVPSTWNGWRSPWPIIRWSGSRATARSPRSMASVRSHGGTPPSSPRNGSISAAVIFAPGPVGGAQEVDEAEQAARLVAHPGDQPGAAFGVDLEPCLGEVLGTHSPTLRPGLVSTTAPPTCAIASVSALGTLPPPLEDQPGRGQRIVRGSRRAAGPARRARASPRLGRGRRGTSVKNGGVWAASTRARSGSPSSAGAPTSTSSTISARSSSPTRSSTRSRTASRSRTSSSPFSR